MNKSAALTGLGVVIGLIIGIIIGGAMADTNKTEQPKSVSSITVREYLEPYTGVGSGVFKHGTIVRLNESGQPTVIGNFADETGADHPGTWVLRKHITE